MERKEAIEIARKLYNESLFLKKDKEAMEILIPELKESDGEKIRKAIIQFFELQDDNTTYSLVPKKDILAWLEKQGKQEQLYIRFGEIPNDEKSKIYQGEIEVGTENGVSVYPAFETNNGDIILGLNLPITKTTLHTQQHLLEYDDRPCYLVKGNYVGKDTDGQPLIDNVSIIKRIGGYRVKEERIDNKNYVKSADNIESSAFKDKLLELFQKFRYLKEGVPTNGDIIDYVDAHIQELINTMQTSSWSEEDKKILLWIIGDIKRLERNHKKADVIAKMEINLLNSIKDRVLQQNITITDEELAKAKKDAYNDILDKIEYDSENPTFDDGWSAAINYIIKKSLKDRVQPQNGYNPYKEVVESIAEMCKHYDTASHSGLRDFYDNVGVKCKDAKEYDSLYPQTTWKPSDRELGAILAAIGDERQKGSDLVKELQNIYQQLKKLREE